MFEYNGQLKKLREQIVRKQHLEAVEQELLQQQTALVEKVSRLETAKLEEQADVDRLEGHSLAAFFYHVIGRMDQKLDQERREAYEARVKYDVAVRELEVVKNDLQNCRGELQQLQGCENRYRQLLREKTAAMKKAGGGSADQILKLEERITQLKSQEKELREAISAGTTAKNTADSIMSRLDSAEGWGTWDILGGGLIADMAKHSHLDEAQAMIIQLQTQLRRFKTELVDVTIQADFQINVDGFLRFADYFFDGLFADWAVMDQISRAMEQVERIKTQIREVLWTLEDRVIASEQERTELETKLEEFVAEALL